MVHQHFGKFTPTSLDNVDSALDEWGMDRGQIYTITVHSGSPFEGTMDAHEGDVYVNFAPEGMDHEVHVYKNNCWTAWDPAVILRVTLVGIDVLAAPCPTTGLRYVETEEEFRNTPTDLPINIQTLAELIVWEAQYPQLVNKRKRAVNLKKIEEDLKKMDVDDDTQTSVPSPAAASTDVDMNPPEDEVMDLGDNDDISAAQFMAKGPLAKDVKVEKYPLTVSMAYKNDRDTRERLRNFLAHGVAVLAHGWSPETALDGLTVADISSYRPPINQTISWQDADVRGKILAQKAAKRNLEESIVVGDLVEFVMSAEGDNTHVWNCLDLPVLNPEVPALVHITMDDQHALMATARESYTATFSYVRVGAKLWGYLALQNVDNNDQAAVLQAWTKYYNTPLASDTYHKGVDVGTVLLERDVILIQPPGINHMVYTPRPSVMYGGHMYSYDTMHLTEFVIVFDHGIDQGGRQRLQASNAIHPGFYRRSLIGMCSIIDKVTQKMLEEDEDVVDIDDTGAMADEVAVEHIRACQILDKVMFFLDVEDAYTEMRKGDWKEPGPMVDLTRIIFGLPFRAVFRFSHPYLIAHSLFPIYYTWQHMDTPYHVTTTGTNG
ncbi:hypothetical protein L210DRAFT_3507531 [Boletus edulis BED1]|uniref:JmjC domain-containing protein n=1 Tax=Boletus edulis BED1 TaxID=1328754 RepID=A0AAD4G9N4_BOLED|nr:hypothetical protein L210DRAFT_3507531 [Boletus edulis BED1]